jgi:hypothetical protein
LLRCARNDAGGLLKRIFLGSKRKPSAAAAAEGFCESRTQLFATVTATNS